MTRELLFTPEQVAEQLGLHVKTVRRYIREGRLEAVKVGERYRVSRDALEAFTGVALDGDVAPARPATDVSTILVVDDLGRNDADRLTTLLVASAQGRKSEQSLRVETSYDPQRERLKVLCNGDLAATMSLLALANAVLEDLS